MTRRLLAAVLVLVVVGCGQEGSAPSDLGPDLDAGHEIFSTTCATCHGGNGEGGSAPALTAVLETFGSCAAQMEWIGLGSQRWQEEKGATYGDTDNEITMVMPGFSESLTDTEIAQVAAYERHRFGGAPADGTRADCGL